MNQITNIAINLEPEDVQNKNIIILEIFLILNYLKIQNQVLYLK